MWAPQGWLGLVGQSSFLPLASLAQSSTHSRGFITSAKLLKSFLVLALPPLENGRPLNSIFYSSFQNVLILLCTKLCILGSVLLPNS